MNLLFICTHNRCRSILSEAISNHIGNGLIHAKSAGSHPVDAVHPSTLQALKSHGIPIDNLQSTSWDNLEGFEPDAVITVCGNARDESCPVWMATHVKAHWGLPDPSLVTGPTQDIDLAFNAVIDVITLRINTLISHLQDSQQPVDLKTLLTNISNKT